MLDNKQRFYLPKSMNIASFSDRMVAAFIDLILTSVVMTLLMSVSNKYGVFLGILFSFTYSIVAQKVFGFTIGKKAMSIFIVNCEPTPITWKQLILRETIGKMASCLSLGYGFWRMIFFAETWHDKFSKTQIVSEKKYKASFMQAFTTMGTLIVVIGFSVYFVIFKTTFVAQLVVQSLEEKGHIIKGLKGDLKTGWTVEYWSGSTSEFNFELNNVSFKYDFESFYKNNILHIADIQVSQANVRAKVIPNFLSKETKNEVVTEVQDEKRERFKIDKLIIDKINLAKMNFSRPGAPDLNVDRFYIQNLVMDKRAVSLKQAFLDSTTLKTQVWNSELNLQSNDLILNATFELRPGFHPLIIKPVAGKVAFTGSYSSPKMLQLSLFDQRVRIAYKNSGLTIATKGFTPSRYIQYSTALSNISARLSNSFCNGLDCFAKFEILGSFNFNGKRFTFKDHHVWPAESPEETMRLQFAAIWLNAVDTVPLFAVSTNTEIPEYVSQLYYKKSYYFLSDLEKRNIQRWKPAFYKYSNRTISTDPDAIPSKDQFNTQ
jgi:uncharacterized RDD family membrane protein YckC